PPTRAPCTIVEPSRTYGAFVGGSSEAFSTKTRSWPGRNALANGPTPPCTYTVRDDCTLFIAAAIGESVRRTSSSAGSVQTKSCAAMATYAMAAHARIQAKAYATKKAYIGRKATE